MTKNLFITGASGFLGRRLVADLLRGDDCTIAVLVRSREAVESLRQAVEPRDWPRVRPVFGDVTDSHLGLDAPAFSQLAHATDEVWHLAASTAFEESKRSDIFRVNLDGTGNLLGALGRFHKLKTCYHMSTAYVCGLQLGEIPEGPVTVSAGFKNSYEESKHCAEAMVRDSRLPAVVLRPSITLGDSQTGENGNDIRMLYGYALALLRAAAHAYGSSEAYWASWHDERAEPRDVDARLLVDPDAEKNVVTVDDVVSVCLAVRRSKTPVGKTFNIVNPQHIACSEILDCIERAIRVRGYSSDPSLTHSHAKGGTAVERAAFRYTRLFWPYTLNTEPDWRTDNVDALEVPRVVMTPDLFEWLMTAFVRTLAPVNVEDRCRNVA